MTEHTPTPADVFKKAGKPATDAGEALKKLGDAIPSKDDGKKPFVRPDHLMHRPFRENAALQALQAKQRASEGRRTQNPKAQRQR